MAHLKITPTESVTIRESTPDVLEVVAVYGPTSPLGRLRGYGPT